MRQISRLSGMVTLIRVTFVGILGCPLATISAFYQIQRINVDFTSNIVNKVVNICQLCSLNLM